MSQPEWMQKFQQIGLKNVEEVTADSAAAAKPAADSGPPMSPTSRFDKFENKSNPAANTTTPPWMLKLKKNPVEDSKPTSTEDNANDEDAAALFAMAGNTPAARKTGELTPEEESIATRYRKMLKMGMPEGAVIQKMQVEEVLQHVQDAVLAEEETSPPSPKVATSFGSSTSSTPETVEKSKSEVPASAGPLGAPQPGNEEDEVVDEEEIMDDESMEEEIIEEEVVEESAVTSADQQAVAGVALASTAGDKEVSPKMTDEEFGDRWVVDKDQVMMELSSTKFEEVEVERDEGNVHYEEVYIDDDGNEVILPPPASRAGPVDIDEDVNGTEGIVGDEEVPNEDREISVAVLAAASSEAPPEQYVEPPYRDPALYDVEMQKKVLNRGTNLAYRSKMAAWVPYAFFFVVIASAVLVLLFVVLADDDGIDVNNIPTASPTPQNFIPLEPTAGDVDVAATTPLDPITADCDFSASVQPHVITQCACTGSISIVAEDVLQRYNSLKTSFMPTVIPDFDEDISSCEPSNQALIWLSTGTNNAGESQAFVRRQRFALAYFFLDQGGIAWADNTNWLSENEVCVWDRVSCDTDGRIVAMDVSNNRVIGQLSTAITLLEFMDTFDGSRNRMEGTIPVEILSTSTLRSLDLSSNSLSGGIPDFPPEGSQLEIINFANNDLTSAVPSSIGNLKSLSSLNLAQNAFAGPLPLSMFRLPLQELYLEGNLLAGVIPNELSSLSLLKTLTLGSNAWTGDIPSALGDITTLTRLTIEDVPTLGGRLPASFGIGLTNLVSFVLTGTDVRGNIPEQFGQMTALEDLDLSRNALGRALPTELGLLTNLKLLNLEDNTFTGMIPNQLGNALELTELRLNQNELVGSLPSTLGAMSNLETLNLNSNFLDGRAPEEVCNLRQQSLDEFIVDCPERVSDVLVTGIICTIPSCCTACVS